jgi:trehalose 6-phosphate phosphatase
MRNVLEPAARPALDAVARAPHLVVLDFDGTLAPIVDDPAAAAIPGSTRALLRLVSLLYPCAVVSGRARADLAPRLAGLPLAAIVGNHGAEAGFGPVDRSVREAVLSWRAALGEALGRRAGVHVEDKGLSLAVHYRAAPDRGEARRAARDAAAGLRGARVFAGRCVLNVVPADAHDKGAAIEALAARLGVPRAVYAGDDVTDEDAFRSRAVTTGVRVGRTHASAAPWYVPAQPDVDGLLRELVRARRRADGLPEDTAALERIARA